MLFVTILIIILEITNIVLSIVLYQEPKNEEYFCNVRQVEVPKSRYILPEPRYMIVTSILTGLMLGVFYALAINSRVYEPLIYIAIGLVTLSYLAELTRKITIENNQLTMSVFFFFKKIISLDDIKGIYVYSYNKKFLKQHALTTKLVVNVKDNKRYRFIISSFSNKKVFNMLKDNFGVINNKLYFQKSK